MWSQRSSDWPTTVGNQAGLGLSIRSNVPDKGQIGVFMRLDVPTSFFQQAMDESTRAVLAQAIRDAFSSSGIDQNEEYVDSLISRVDGDGTYINKN